VFPVGDLAQQIDELIASRACEGCHVNHQRKTLGKDLSNIEASGAAIAFTSSRTPQEKTLSDST
jgi:hypothetical protein